MELLIEEREAEGRFRSVDDFARRVDPRLLNKRQLETLAGAGAFDALEPNRAGLFAAAETVLAVAQRTQDSRASGQGGLFGESEPGGGAIALPKSAHWSLADRIAAEKDAFGYYFSAHPLDRYEHLAKLHGARPIASLGDIPIPEGARIGATVAALIEDARWRTSARGNRYLMATISDTSAQTPTTCFDELAAKDMEEAARAGGCAILTVELDKRPGEDTPRVTVRRVQPFESLANNAQLLLEVAVDDPRALPILAGIVGDQRGGRGQILVRAAIVGGEAEMILGRDFRLDGELARKIENLDGIRSAWFKSADNPKLAAAA
jgi:DNA polymerase-3 subunit alpha